MTNITILGYYGFKNAGDEAVLAGIVSRLHEHAAGAKITVLSADPAYTEATHGVDAVIRSGFRPVGRLFDRTNLLIVGGGGLLQDVTSRRSLWYYAGLTRMARLKGVPVVTYGLGVGPLLHRDSRFLVRLAFGGAAAITVRDSDSAIELARCGIDRALIEVTGDASLGLPSPSNSELVEAHLQLSALGGEPCIGVAVRPWGDNSWMPGLASRLAELAAGLSARLAFVSMQPVSDYPIAVRMAEMAGPLASVLRPEENPRRVAALLGACRWVVAMRLHALVFGALSGRPSVGLHYDPKVSRFARQCGLSSIGLDEAAATGVAGGLHEFDGPAAARRVAALRAAEEYSAWAVVRVLARKGQHEKR